MYNTKFLENYRKKRVLITGHTGFKGSWLAFILNYLGADIVGYALEPDLKKSNFRLLGLENKITHIVGDVRSYKDLERVVKNFQPEIVFHLAAQAIVRSSYEDPVGNYETNIMGSVNLLDVIRNCNSVRSLVFITSDKCYENLEWPWGYRENDRLGGYDPYSSSKACAELIFSSYYKSFLQNRTIGAASVRAGNVIGGGDWSQNRIIPDCIRSIQDGKPITIRSPNATRPWQHVLDPLSGYLMLGEKLYTSQKKFCGSWNFGPSTSELRTVKDMVSIFFKSYGEGSFITEVKGDDLHEAGLLQLNCDKARMFLNWAPRWDVLKTVQKTSEWYRFIASGGQAEEITMRQVKEYFELG